MSLYRKNEWASFRNKILKLDGHTCRRCRRCASKEVILQVHHKFYITGKMPWEYPYDACETLCKGCHASEHGLVRPYSGWACIGFEDLENLSGECQLCGQRIRYVFSVYHSKWPILDVGTTCCDNLTGELVAQAELDAYINYEARKNRFLNSPQWIVDENGDLRISKNNIIIIIRNTKSFIKIIVNKICGKRQFLSIDDAKKHAFEIIDNGKLSYFIGSRKTSMDSGNRNPIANAVIGNYRQKF